MAIQEILEEIKKIRIKIISEIALRNLGLE